MLSSLRKALIAIVLLLGVPGRSSGCADWWKIHNRFYGGITRECLVASVLRILEGPDMESRLSSLNFEAVVHDGGRQS